MRPRQRAGVAVGLGRGYLPALVVELVAADVDTERNRAAGVVAVG